MNDQQRPALTFSKAQAHFKELVQNAKITNFELNGTGKINA